MIKVEVVYGNADKQTLIEVSVPEGASAQMALMHSGITKLHPEIDLNDLQLGIFSRPIESHTKLSPKDRVEIYRPLAIDPMQGRGMHAKKT